MDECVNRLLVVGPALDVTAFERSADWTEAVSAKHVELLEQAPARHAWQFETDVPPLKSLRDLSRDWPFLTFVLDYDCEVKRVKGLVRFKHGQSVHSQVLY
jgi:hypothetical protein